MNSQRLQNFYLQFKPKVDVLLTEANAHVCSFHLKFRNEHKTCGTNLKNKTNKRRPQTCEQIIVFKNKKKMQPVCQIRVVMKLIH